MIYKICFCIATSKVTWKRLQFMACNSTFLSARSQFSLAVIMNGDSNAYEAYLKALNPDYLIIRKNIGNEAGAYNDAIHNLPAHEWYCFMHDDHWFWNDAWFESILDCANTSEKVCYGNLITCDFLWNEEFNAITQKWSFELPPGNIRVTILQGMAGLHHRSVIETLLNCGGIPYFEGKREFFNHFHERLFSYILIKEKIPFKSLPGGYEYLLLHRTYALSPENNLHLLRLPMKIQQYISNLHNLRI
jgi:hypothetical protein